MGILSKKRTPAQQEELWDFSCMLQGVRLRCQEIMVDIQAVCLLGSAETCDLYYICRQALLEDRDLSSEEYAVEPVRAGSGRLHYARRDPEAIVDIGALIGEVGYAIQSCRLGVIDEQAKVLSCKPFSWWPRECRRTHESWRLYFELMLQHVDIALEGLKPPESLKHDPKHGNDKLNMFVQGLNEMALTHLSSLPKEPNSSGFGLKRS